MILCSPIDLGRHEIYASLLPVEKGEDSNLTFVSLRLDL